MQHLVAEFTYDKMKIWPKTVCTTCALLENIRMTTNFHLKIRCKSPIYIGYVEEKDIKHPL